MAVRDAPEPFKPPKEIAKMELVRLIGNGYPVTAALKVIDRSESTYRGWRKDTEWAALVDRAKGNARSGSKGPMSGMEIPDFPEFCRNPRWIGQPLAWHQYQWLDLLNDKEPRHLHPSQTYIKGSPSRIMVNTPPGHAKSTTLIVNYVVWRIIKDPNISILLISKNQELAEAFLLQVKERLTSSQYEGIQMDFGPAGGWKEGSAGWRNDEIYVGNRDVESKDPTVRAIGIGGQITGRRSDLIIVDDPIDDTNFQHYEKQLRIINVSCYTRLPRGHRAKMLVIGAKQRPVDIYSELLNDSRYPNNSKGSPWTVLTQPAELEPNDDPTLTMTTWPWSEYEEDVDTLPVPNAKENLGNIWIGVREALEDAGDDLYVRWQGPELMQIKEGFSHDEWALQYQQATVSDSAPFKFEVISANCNMWNCGVNAAGEYNFKDTDDPQFGLPGGLNSLYLVAGLDYADAGFTSAILYGIYLNPGPLNGHRFIIDIHNEAGMTTDSLRKLFHDWTAKYNIREWRVERNSQQNYMVKDNVIVDFLAKYNTKLVPHLTQQYVKYDADYGVSAMAVLFERGMIHLPNPNQQIVRDFMQQLSIWQPKKKGIKTDMVMALWFCEIRALEFVRTGTVQGMFRKSAGLNRGDIARRRIRNVQTGEIKSVHSGSGSRLLARLNEGVAI